MQRTLQQVNILSRAARKRWSVSCHDMLPFPEAVFKLEAQILILLALEMHQEDIMLNARNMGCLCQRL